MFGCKQTAIYNKNSYNQYNIYCIVLIARSSDDDDDDDDASKNVFRRPSSIFDLEENVVEPVFAKNYLVSSLLQAV